MGCPLRWCGEEAGGVGSGFVVLPLSLFLYMPGLSLVCSTGRNNVKRGTLSQDVVM